MNDTARASTIRWPGRCSEGHVQEDRFSRSRAVHLAPKRSITVVQRAGSGWKERELRGGKRVTLAKPKVAFDVDDVYEGVTSIRSDCSLMNSLLVVVALLSQAPETVPGAQFEKTNKPSGLMPEHLRVPVEGFGKLDVVSVPAWEKLFAVDPKTVETCVTRPVAALKKALKAKGAPVANQELLLVGCPDSSAPFTVQARHLRIGKVDGLLYVTQLFIEDVLTSNSGLQAWFQGLSDDGKTYVVGAFKVKAKGLRDDAGELAKDAAKLKKQIAEDAAMLGKLKADEYEPSLDALAAGLGRVQLPK
jgi:hypothetical protein